MARRPRASVRDLSYAGSAPTWGGRLLIRCLENATGRLGLIRRAAGYERDVADGAPFFDVMVRRFGLSLDVQRGTLDLIPRQGPVIVVSNHPFGILDGLMMGHLLTKTRGDFRILANSVFNRSEDLNAMLLPISFDTTKRALALNLETRRAALDHLALGGVIGVFPGGTVSTGVTAGKPPMDPRWRSFTARMIAKSDAVVVPVFFHGQNSRVFQRASHLHANLRLGLLIREFSARVESSVAMSVGAPIGRDILDPLAKDGTALMDFLRKTTYALSPDADPCFDLGYDYETLQSV
ncbi:lysophospholipid acyltransferase family protein [Sulfitobacter sp. SK011]|uniref:lysophospholipid acyltransferase family protein n=1 Tax=Sulfitobacter sp. SK011 TaxID=1389004 RepID=UPI000E0AFAC5|nr:lysophospholipid acyltransferase family protein [Sulfitobacter sp. SK011]AXI42774.1 acyltransferase [Sulfitobacter sp. SK011]